MPKNLKRYYGHGDLHFITFSCYRRLPHLRTPASRNTFLQALSDIRDRYEFRLVGYVVMPEHVHLLIGESSPGTPSTIVKVLKERVSRKLRVKPASPFWQARFYDFNVYSAKKEREKLDYMHANPVVRGLVNDPANWIWSSFSVHEKSTGGLVSLDPSA